MSFWQEEEARQRMATYRARFMSWQYSRKVVPPPFWPGEHWWHLPMRFADTGEPVTVEGGRE